MKFCLFKQLYSEALEEATTLELFIAERGWQEWMDEYEPQEIADILTKIYTLATNPLKNTRIGSQADFARVYGIPVRSLQNWDSGDRTPPLYVKMLIDYAQFNH